MKVFMDLAGDEAFNKRPIVLPHLLSALPIPPFIQQKLTQMRHFSVILLRDANPALDLVSKLLKTFGRNIFGSTARMSCRCSRSS
jgi:hypothetical protein